MAAYPAEEAGVYTGYSDLCIEAAADGWSYEELINRILDEAVERYEALGPN